MTRSLAKKLPLLLSLAVLSLWATTARAADPGTTLLSYEGYAGGFQILDASVALGQGRTAYRVHLKAASAGAIGWFAPFSFQAEAEGVREDARLRPSRYEALSQRKGKSKRLTIRYDSTALPSVTAEPPRSDLATTDHLSLAQRANTYDPVSGLVQLLDAALAGGACSDDVAIFDGKRRLELKSRDGGEVTLNASSYNMYRGPARRCLVEVGDIRGKDLDSGRLERMPRRFTIYLASPREGLAPVPVRAEVETVIGSILLHLTAVTPGGRSQAELR